MKSKSCLEYYCEQGLFTSPGQYQYVLDQFPRDMFGLSECIHKTMLIDFLVNMGLVSVSTKHIDDHNIRGIEAKLAEIIDRDSSNIENLRSYDNLLLGNCRDLSLMMCSVLRNQNIPARLRSGFATFFDPQKYFDHWVCEYWDKSKERWIKVDQWMSQVQYRKEILPTQMREGLLTLDYNPYDVKEEHFTTGGQAWINCRENGHNPDNYGTYGDLLKGGWFVRDNMIRDLLCLNKLEPLPWDCWGLMGKEKSDINSEELMLLDEVARFLCRDDFSETTLSNKLVSLQIEKNIVEMV